MISDFFDAYYVYKLKLYLFQHTALLSVASFPFSFSKFRRSDDCDVCAYRVKRLGCHDLDQRIIRWAISWLMTFLIIIVAHIELLHKFVYSKIRRFCI